MDPSDRPHLDGYDERRRDSSRPDFDDDGPRTDAPWMRNPAQHNDYNARSLPPQHHRPGSFAGPEDRGRPPVSVTWPVSAQPAGSYVMGTPAQGTAGPFGVVYPTGPNAFAPTPGDPGSSFLGSSQPVSVAAFGRLCRELAAVQARARPLLWEAFVATSRAKAQAADPYFGGGAMVPVARDVEAWLLGCMRRAAEQVADPLMQRYRDLLTTSTVRAGLAAAGYNASKDALAVLRSAFRVRPEYGESPTAAASVPASQSTRSTT